MKEIRCFAAARGFLRGGFFLAVMLADCSSPGTTRTEAPPLSKAPLAACWRPTSP